MTAQGNGQPTVYKVIVSDLVKDRLRKLYREAAEAGEGKEFLSSLRQAIGRLHQDPLNFGEPQYRLPALKVVVFQAAVGNLVVDYAVYEEKPLVFIRAFKVLS